MRSYSIYISIVEGYSTTVITFETLFRPGLNFTKCIIIAAGTQDPRLLGFLEQIQQTGYAGYPKEKFIIIVQPLDQAMGMGEALNHAITLTSEDLFYTSNNCWFSSQTLPLLLTTVQSSADNVFALCPNNVMSLWSNIRENYDSRVRARLIDQDQKGPQHYRQTIEDFFHAHGPYPGKDVEQNLIQVASTQPEMRVDDIGDAGIYFKRTCFQRVGFFDERFSRTPLGQPCGGEEFDYCDRIHQAGGQVVKVCQAVALHLLYGQTSKTGYRGEQESQLRERYFQKRFHQDTTVWYRGHALPVLHNTEQYSSMP
ncbi:hypothetical protein HY496_01030 [Candidatus Woesearchaeota archaeon]|nr:hypothetical protein [Candidatus Woesearchaeota archaeon]